MAIPRPTLDHYQGDCLTHPILLTGYYLFQPKGKRKPRYKVGFLSPPQCLLGSDSLATLWTAGPHSSLSPVLCCNSFIQLSVKIAVFCEMEVNCTWTSKDLKHYYFTCGIARLEYFFYYLHKKQLKKLIRNKSPKKKLWKITVFLSKTTFLWNGGFYFNHNETKTASKI